jgi:hypothetical protein
MPAQEAGFRRRRAALLYIVELNNPTMPEQVTSVLILAKEKKRSPASAERAEPCECC